MWRYYGQERPDFAESPGPDQISVWDYPRPPRIEQENREVAIFTGAGELLARTVSALRLCETASPPQFYIPMEDVVLMHLVVTAGSSFCEWKGRARYWALTEQGEAVGWDYPDVDHAYQALRKHIAFYPGRLKCTVAGEAVVPQPGEFYGGWITPELVGPFKGNPGTGHW
jgi:uncharacterized protein (DUF427 family)